MLRWLVWPSAVIRTPVESSPSRWPGSSIAPADSWSSRPLLFAAAGLCLRPRADRARRPPVHRTLARPATHHRVRAAGLGNVRSVALSEVGLALEWLATPLSSDDHGQPAGCTPIVAGLPRSVPSAGSPGVWRGSAATADWSLLSRSRHSLRSSSLMFAAIASPLADSPRAVRRPCSPSRSPWSAYRAIGRAISRNAWRWARPSHSWAMALTSAMAFRASARSRAAIGGLTAAPAAAADPPARPTTRCRSRTSRQVSCGSAPTP